MGDKANLGSVVYLYYKGGPVGEEPQDVRVDGEPLRVMLGNMALPRGIENAVIGMAAGEEKTITVSADDGFGRYQDGLAQWYPRMQLPNGYGLHVGDMLYKTNTDDGSKMPAFVVQETADNVRIDLNHPWAGKDLEYWVRLERMD